MGMKRIGGLIVAAALVLPTICAPAQARAADALAAVAANYAGAMKSLSEAFTGKTGKTIAFTTGSTGKLYAQIAQGAPFDIMLSADARTPEKLEADGLGVAGSRFTYAVGRLTLWSADAGRIGDDPVAALRDRATLKIAIANPELAPYGAAAREALQSLGAWDAIQPKLVFGENIGQAYSMVESGAAQMGFVALSAVISPERAQTGSRFDIPQELHQPIRQDAILLKHGEANEAARQFLEFLKSPQAREISARYGYGGT
jgi:molybdate transport system substrate-binding protein